MTDTPRRSRFMHKVRSHTEQASAAQALPVQHLRYRLEPCTTASLLPLADLQLSVMIAGVELRSQAYREEAFAVQPYQLTAPPRFMQGEDSNLLRELIDLDAGWAQASSRRGVPEGDFFQRLLNTGRLYWEEQEQPLSVNDVPVALSCDWRCDDSGLQALQVQGEGVQCCVDAQPLLAIHSGAKQCSPVSHSWGAEAVALIAQRPQVSPQASATYVKQHRQALLAAQLPLPQVFALQRVANHIPQPCLELSSELLSTAQRQPLDVITLSFLYPGQTAEVPHPWTGQEQSMVLATQYSAGGVFEVSSNPIAEQAQRLVLQQHFPRLKYVARQQGFILEGVEGTQDSRLLWQDIVLTQLPRLKKLGWRIVVAEGFRYHYARVDAWYGQAQVAAEAEDWLGVDIGIQVEGERINLLPVLADYLQRDNSPLALPVLQAMEKHELVSLLLSDGRIVALEAGRLRQLVLVFTELLGKAKWQADHALKIPQAQALRLAQLDMQIGVQGDLGDVPTFTWLNDAVYPDALQRLWNPPAVAAPEHFNAQLRDYQLHALAWMQSLSRHNVGGILADDMGLGKTIQTLAHLSLEKQQGRLDQSALIVVPTSLLFNWARECKQFATQLSCQVLHGATRHGLFTQPADVYITSYALVLRDSDHWQQKTLDYVILDEAQNIKNSRSQITRGIKQLNPRRRLCLSGTPLENHLGELWSLFDFVMPGFLGNEAEFKREFRKPIEQQNDEHRQAALLARISPYILRRTKNEVAKELPPKTEQLCRIAMDEVQRDCYDMVRTMAHKNMQEILKQQGAAQSRINMLDALLKLRQACCDPRLLPAHYHIPEPDKHSAKLQFLMQMLRELVQEGRKIIVFSQFTGMLDIMLQQARSEGISYSLLTGKTRQREQAIDAFQEGDNSVFFISLKAGGVGLNLTAADTVIHYDPWWNPAAEQQATDRAYRIGQDKPVFVYKLIAENTIEEKIQQLQQRKQALSKRVYSVAEHRSEMRTDDADRLSGTGISEQEILALLAGDDTEVNAI